MQQKKQGVFSMMHVLAGCLLFVLGIVAAQAAAVLQFSKLPDGG